MLYLGMDKDAHPDLPNVEGPMLQFIELYGFPIPVEQWAEYAAIDPDGKIYIFETGPTDYDTEWMAVAGGRIRCAGECDLEGYNWRETLIELREERTYVPNLVSSTRNLIGL